MNFEKEERFENLRNQFSQLVQKFPLKKTRNSAEPLENLMKSFEFLNQLETCFHQAQVSHLFEFVTSIFKFAYSIQLEINPRHKRQLNNKPQSTLNVKLLEQKQIQTENLKDQFLINQEKCRCVKRRKRSCLEIDLDLEPHTFSQQSKEKQNIEKFNALKELVNERNETKNLDDKFHFDEQFVPHTDAFKFSGVDETIKFTLENLKNSTEQTKEFLEVYDKLKNQRIECKMFNQCFNRENKSKAQHFLFKWKHYKEKIQNKLQLYSKVIHQNFNEKEQFYNLNIFQQKHSIYQLKRCQSIGLGKLKEKRFEEKLRFSTKDKKVEINKNLNVIEVETIGNQTNFNGSRRSFSNLASNKTIDENRYTSNNVALNGKDFRKSILTKEAKKRILFKKSMGDL